MTTLPKSQVHQPAASELYPTLSGGKSQSMLLRMLLLACALRIGGMIIDNHAKYKGSQAAKDLEEWCKNAPLEKQQEALARLAKLLEHANGEEMERSFGIEYVRRRPLDLDVGKFTIPSVGNSRLPVARDCGWQ